MITLDNVIHLPVYDKNVFKEGKLKPYELAEIDSYDRRAVYYVLGLDSSKTVIRVTNFVDAVTGLVTESPSGFPLMAVKKYRVIEEL